MECVMMKIIMVVAILMEAIVVVKMLTQTFAPYVNALKKKLQSQIVNFFFSAIFHINYILKDFRKPKI